MKFIFGKFTFTIGGLLLALVQYALALLGALMADSSGASLVDIHQSAPVLIAFLVWILVLPILGFLADQSIDRKLAEQQQFRPKFLNLKKYLDYLARYAENIQQEDFSIELNLKRKDRLSAALASIRSKLKAQQEALGSSDPKKAAALESQIDDVRQLDDLLYDLVLKAPSLDFNEGVVKNHAKFASVLRRLR